MTRVAALKEIVKTDAGRHLVRFVFCKRDEVIAEASRRLAALR